MSEDKNNENECFMDTTDSQDNTNLCCCYAIMRTIITQIHATFLSMSAAVAKLHDDS